MLLPRLVWLACSAALGLAPPASEYQVKITLLAKLPSFVEWPATNPGSGSGTPFLLGVVGRNPFGDELELYFLDHKIKGRAVLVRYFNKPQDIGPCDLLFVCSSERTNLPSILARTRKQPTLTVGDSEGFAKEGVMINLMKNGDRLAFEANLQAVREAGLVLSKTFLPVIKHLW